MAKVTGQPVEAPVMQVKPVGGDERTAMYVWISLILIAASIMTLTNLGDCYLWGDEAQTALVSRTILTHGVPMGTDGKNFFSVSYGAEYGPDFVWRWQPWLPFYVLALFFKLFGTSTLVARLPFALFGVLSAAVAYLFGKSLWKSNRAGLLCATLLITSVPMLLLVRQCRYYSMVTFFCLTGLYAYHLMMQGRRYSATAFFAASFLLFHSMHIYLAALLATALVHSFVFHRDRFKQVFVLSLIVTAVNIPWLVFFTNSASNYTQNVPFMLRVHVQLIFLLHQTIRHILPSWQVLLGLGVVLVLLPRVRKIRIRDATTVESLCLVGLFILMTVVVLTLTVRPFFRYVAPIIPAMCLLTALLLDVAMKLHPAVGLVAVSVIAYQGRIADYAYELTHDFAGPVEGTVQYLNDHGKPGDIVAVPHDALPVMFYTDMTVVSAVSGQSFEPAKDADWIVMRRQAFIDMEDRLFDFLGQNCDPKDFETIELDAPSTLEQNRESPDDHYYRTQTNSPKVLIFKRIRKPAT